MVAITIIFVGVLRYCLCVYNQAKFGFCDDPLPSLRSRRLGYALAVLDFKTNYSAVTATSLRSRSLGVFASPRVANPLKGRLRQGLWYRWIVDREIGRMKRDD